MSTQVIRIFKEHPIISTLYITDIGFFPKAKNHHVSRGTECESYILLLCVEGKGYFELNGEKYSLNKNQYCIIPKKTDHKYYADKKNPWSIYWLHFDGSLARQYFELLQKDFFGDRLSLSQEEEAIVLIRLIYRLLEADYTLEKLIYVTNQFGILLSKLICIVSDEKNTSTDPF